jgi:hypothetical protein
MCREISKNSRRISSIDRQTQSWRAMVMPISIVARFFIVLSIVAVAGRSSTCQAQAQTAVAPVAKQPSLLVVLIGGMDSDPTADQVRKTAKRAEGNSGLYRLMGDLQHDQIETRYFNWNGTAAGQIKTKPVPGQKAIIDSIRDHLQAHPQSKVILVGNSWGGHTVCQVCQEIGEGPDLVPIEFAVFLDPSSTGRAGRGRPDKLPANVKQAVNYHTRNLFCWRAWPNDKRFENIDLGDQQYGFLVRGGPAYDASFNFDAHVAAEWDERVHADIRTRVLNYLPKNEASKN